MSSKKTVTAVVVAAIGAILFSAPAAWADQPDGIYYSRTVQTTDGYSCGVVVVAGSHYNSQVNPSDANKPLQQYCQFPEQKATTVSAGALK